MATLEQALVAELDKTSTYKTLTDGRIYPLVLPQSVTLPASVYQRISTPRYHAFQADTDLASPRMQLDHYSTSYSTVKAVAGACQAKLQNFKGTMGSGTNSVSGVAVLLVDESEHYEKDTLYWRVRQDYTIYHKEG